MYVSPSSSPGNGPHPVEDPNHPGRQSTYRPPVPTVRTVIRRRLPALSHTETAVRQGRAKTPGGVQRCARPAEGAPVTEPGTFRLMYRSRNRIPPEQRRTELGGLFSQARGNNKRSGLTGALLLRDDWFVQVLEGDEATVRALYERIAADPRHDSVTLLGTGTVTERVFARWSMAKVAADGEPDIPLIAHTDGIAAAAARGTSPAQHVLLDAMRAAARETAPA